MGAKPYPNGGKIMNIKENRFLVKENSFVIDFNCVDFVTYTQNENNPNQYLVKFHIGNKEARLMTKSLDETIEILDGWSSSKSNKHVFFNEKDFEYGRN